MNTHSFKAVQAYLFVAMTAVVVCSPLTASGADRVVLGEGFTATW